MKINNYLERYDGSVFLGGPENSKSTWREKLIDNLNPKVPYYSPDIADRSFVDTIRENDCKRISRINVYVISGDEFGLRTGNEIIEEAKMAPEKFVFVAIDILEKQRKEISELEEALLKAGCAICNSLEDLAKYINSEYVK